MEKLPDALLAFSAYRQFIVYKIIPRPNQPGKMDKVPCDYESGRVKVDAHDPKYWTDAATAQRIAAHWGQEYGTGFVFTDDDPFWFLDIDTDWNGKTTS